MLGDCPINCGANQHAAGGPDKCWSCLTATDGHMKSVISSSQAYCWRVCAHCFNRLWNNAGFTWETIPNVGVSGVNDKSTVPAPQKTTAEPVCNCPTLPGAWGIQHRPSCAYLKWNTARLKDKRVELK